ncbi:MAG: hypothetical protein IKQ97_03495 [Eubacterium sp.]|nr:hypothetical protein [Eubacterium sp.]
MKKRLMTTAVVFSLVFTMMLSVVSVSKPAKASKNRWGGDEMDDWPLTITCDPDFPIIGPEVGESREEQISGLQYDKGNRTLAFSVKNYSPDVVEIYKKKKNGPFPGFWVKGLKKGYAHIKVSIKIKYAQNGKKKYTWDIKKYPVGHNDD